MKYHEFHVTNLFIRQKVRRMAGYKNSNIPIVITFGNDYPHLEGDSFHYETTGGKRIYHPNAYKKKGFSNMRYVHSTKCIVIGSNILSKILANN